MKPIALTGPLRSGKDTVAEYLVSKYGYTRFAFGDELKDDFHRRYPEIPRDPKPRIGYQNHGQLMRALIGEDVWVDKCFDEISGRRFFLGTVSLTTGESMEFTPVISDLRQPNEYDRCRSEGYVIIRVVAPEGVRINRAIESADTFNLRDLSHETEQHTDGFAVDYEIENNSSLEALYARVDSVMSELIRKYGD